MSRHPERWGKPVTVRFDERDLATILDAMGQGQFDFGPRRGRSTLSDFIRQAALDRAKTLLLARRVVAPSSTAPIASSRGRR